MSSIDPTPESFRSLFYAVPAGEPVVMSNLLRFRDRASYGAERGEPQRSGPEAYAEFIRCAMPQIESVGGRVIWSGSALHSVIAPAGETWHKVLLVEYPSAETFMNMVRSRAYRAITYHRTASLEDSRLIAIRANVGGPAAISDR